MEVYQPETLSPVEVTEMCREDGRPVRVHGVKPGHEETIQYWITMDSSGADRWSENWRIVDTETEGHDHYGYVVTLRLRLQEYPGYLWKEAPGALHVFVAPDQVAASTAELCQAGCEATE